MTTLRTSFVLLLAICLTAGMILSFSGCSSESPLGSDYSQDVPVMNSMDKKGEKSSKPGYDDYPQSGELTVYYDKKMKAWTGGKIVLTNSSKLHVKDYSFIPPEMGGKNKPKTITMVADKVVNEAGDIELIFTFGPSCSRFDPPAEIRLDWKDMETGQVPDLYYIEGDGTWTELKSKAVDKGDKKIIYEVEHFSRYALSISR